MGRRKRATEQQQDVPAVRLLTKQNQLQQHQKPKAPLSTTDSPPLDSLPAPPRIVKPLALETTPPVEESAAITPVQVFREIAGHLIPSVRMQSPIPLFTAGDGSIWDLNPAVADYLSSDPSISYNVIGIVATDRRMSINDLISCLLADDDGFSAAAAADFTTKWTADSKSSSAFNLWITRNRLIIIECTATLRDAPSFQIIQFLAILMAICNTVVVAVDFKHQDHSRLIRVLRAVEQFPFRMPDLFPVQQKDGQVAATLMADIVFAVMDIPEDRFNVREIEKFYRKLLDSLNKGQYQFMYNLSKITEFSPYLSACPLAIHLIPATDEVYGEDCGAGFRQDSLYQFRNLLLSFTRQEMQRSKPTEKSWFMDLDRVIASVRKSCSLRKV